MNDTHELARLNYGLSARSKFDNRPVLTGALFEFSESDLTVVTADGYQLHKVTINRVWRDLAGQSFLVEVNDLAHVAQLKTARAIHAITTNDQRDLIVSIRMARGKRRDIVCPRLDGRFPLYSSIIPDSASLTTLVTIPHSTLDSLSAHFDAVTFDLSPDHGSIKARVGDFEFCADAFSHCRASKPVTLSVNPAFLANSSFGLDLAVWKISKPTAPIVGSFCDGDVIGVVMPLSTGR